VHVVGAGLAGLAAAVRLADAGVPVSLYEAAPQAGGRCRSYFDTTLDCRIDNGNHLLLAGNRAAMDFLATIGAMDTMIGPVEPVFDFLDLGKDERWRLAPGLGRLPTWLFDAKRRVPGTAPQDYLGVLACLWAGRTETVADRVDRDTVVFRRLWEPLAVAALNTATATGSAALFGRILRETFGAGGAACRPLVPRDGLSESFVDPALARLRSRGAGIRFGARLRAIGNGGARVTSLDFDDGPVAVQSGEAVVLAVTAPVAGRLAPDLTVPDAFCAIVNAHYKVALADDTPLFVGLIGGMAEWVFRKREVLSVTVSAADKLAELPAEELARRLWDDVVRAYDLPRAPPPRWQIVKERRATFAATPAQVARRPGPVTRWTNLVLAGDWTDTGLPATIEGAIRSGDRAAKRIASV
jgi:squalene-associated FAD-dependent desaturase